MKKDLFIALMILLTVTLGCSRLTELAKSGNVGGSSNSNSNTEVPKAADSAPAPAEFAPTQDAKTDIEKLSDRFMAIKSFRATMDGEGQTPMHTELEFAAPDRYRMRMANSMEVVIIGRTTYMKVGDKWQKMQLPVENAIGEMRTTFTKEGMKWISDVKHTGDDTVDGKPAYVYTYHGKAPNNVGENDSKLWIAKSDGLPLKIEATYKSGNLRSMTIEYDYDTPVTIEPPVN
jgi:outer membrane lipoprotein-sorting protein